MEVKQKTNRLGNKINQPVDRKFSLLNNDWKTIREILLKNSNGLIREMLSVSRPVLINLYERDYYISADQQTRLTLDYEHRVYDQRLSSYPNLQFRQPVLDKVVIEVKTDVEHSDNLAKILSYFPLRISQNSKFLDSMESILGFKKRCFCSHNWQPVISL